MLCDIGEDIVAFMMYGDDDCGGHENMLVLRVALWWTSVVITRT